MLTWRTQVPIGKKWNQLRGVVVGEQREAIADSPRGTKRKSRDDSPARSAALARTDEDAEYQGIRTARSATVLNILRTF